MRSLGKQAVGKSTTADNRGRNRGPGKVNSLETYEQKHNAGFEATCSHGWKQSEAISFVQHFSPTSFPFSFFRFAADLFVTAVSQHSTRAGVA